MDLNLTSERQKALSVSSLVDEEDTKGSKQPLALSEHHREVSRSLYLSPNVKTISPVEAIADAPLKSNSLPKRKKRSRPS